MSNGVFKRIGLERAHARRATRLCRMAAAQLGWFAAGVCAAGMLAACSFNDGISPYLADPSRYLLFHCKDLADRLKQVQEQEKKLRGLTDKASDSTGGVVLGTLSYRPDYEKAIAEEKVLRRTAAEKQCALDPPVYQSDQTVR
jgi:hypothetical protein